MGHLFLLLLALLLASAAAAVHAKAAAFTEEKGIAGIRGVLGSRPPSCAGRCRSCGRCEAVQVPVSPQELRRRKRGEAVESKTKKKKTLGHVAAAVAGGRAMPDSYDDHSNYKPLSWRCKCGGFILNP